MMHTRSFTGALVIGQVDDILLVLWYFSIQNDLKEKNGLLASGGSADLAIYYHDGKVEMRFI